MVIKRFFYFFLRASRRRYPIAISSAFQGLCRNRMPMIAVALALGLPAFAVSAIGAENDCAGGEPGAVDGLRAWPSDEPRPVAIEGGHWFRAAQGWIVVADPCSSVIAAREMQAAADAFTRHFGEPVVPGAVVDGALGVQSAEVRDAGAAWVMSWRFPDPDDDDAMTEAEAEMAAKLEGDGLDPESARYAARFWGAAKRRSSGEAGRLEPAPRPEVLRHEIGHALFIHGVWPRPESGARYGGSAPDWLDEAAAVSADAESSTKKRREKFRSIALDDNLIPLSDYFSMEHPLYDNHELLRKIQEASKKVRPGEPIVVQTDPNKDDKQRSRAFYPQTRGMIDFLVERSGNPRILMLITRALKDGDTFEEWLAEAGPANGLPTELDALDRLFRQWAVSEKMNASNAQSNID